MSIQTGTSALPLLEAMLNMTAFHREHEKFYSSSPREQAVALQRHSRTLHALADRWLVTDPSTRTVLSPFEGADDLKRDPRGRPAPSALPVPPATSAMTVDVLASKLAR